MRLGARRRGRPGRQGASRAWGALFDEICDQRDALLVRRHLPRRRCPRVTRRAFARKSGNTRGPSAVRRGAARRARRGGRGAAARRGGRGADPGRGGRKGCLGSPHPPTHPPRTNWTRRVPHPVLSGHGRRGGGGAGPGRGGRKGCLGSCARRRSPRAARGRRAAPGHPPPATRRSRRA